MLTSYIIWVYILDMNDSPNQIFEQIKRVNEYNSEFWSARELAKILEYSDYRNFQIVIEKAKLSCKKSGQSIKYHFVDITETILMPKNASKNIRNTTLSRYACYLIMQNADPSKEVVALGQTYFALQTRRQELQDQLVEDQKRVYLRGEMVTHGKHLAGAASVAGVKNYGTFMNYGYMGLYGGLDSKQIHTRKKLKKDEKILDHMGSEELAANIFRTTQADAKLRREQIMGEARANQVHFEVGKKVRKMIKELGGTMPEKLPVADKITLARRRLKKSQLGIE